MKGIFAAILNFVLLFWAGAKKFVNENALPAVTFLDALKIFIGSEGVNWLVVKTKTNLDDIALEKTKSLLVSAINILDLNKECISKQTDEEIIKCFLNHLNTIPSFQKNAALFKISSIMASVMVEGQKRNFKEFAIDFLVQLAYAKIKK